MCSTERPIYRLSWKSDAEGLRLLDEIGHVYIRSLEDAIDAQRWDYKALRSIELDLGNLLARCQNLVAKAYMAQEQERRRPRSV